MNAQNDTWTNQNWQQLGDIAARLVKEAARAGGGTPAAGLTETPTKGVQGMAFAKDKAPKGGAQ